jgi:hypothetical protein
LNLRKTFRKELTMKCPCGSLSTSWNGKDQLWECSACGTAYPTPPERLLAKADDEEAGWDYAEKE